MEKVIDAGKIVERRYYKIDVRLASPLNVSSGVSEETDRDVMKNGAGEYIVPGTSLAGAFRNYLEATCNETDSVFGFAVGDKGRMSSVFISDLVFDQPKVSVRDMVKLDDRKRAVKGAKFDMQILETGATGSFTLEVLDRGENVPCLAEETIKNLLWALKTNDIRLGSKKQRGFGLLEPTKVSYSVFDSDTLEEWLSFLETKEYAKVITDKDVSKYVSNWIKAPKDGPKYLTINVPLKQEGGISIRTYSTEPGQADYSHITCNGGPVIPGSSWAGALGAEARRILIEACTLLKKDDPAQIADAIKKYWFGNVDVKSKGNQNNNSWKSRGVFTESVLVGAKPLTTSRIAIDRFSAAPKEGALFAEITRVNGTTVLKILVKKDKEKNYEAFLGLLKLVLESLTEGYLAIGGETAIGRGIFSIAGDGQQSFERWCSEEGEPSKDETYYSKKLYNYLKEFQLPQVKGGEANDEPKEE